MLFLVFVVAFALGFGIGTAQATWGARDKLRVLRYRCANAESLNEQVNNALAQAAHQLREIARSVDDLLNHRDRV